MINVEWKGGMRFDASSESGKTFTMDAHPDFGGQDQGPTPVEAFVSALAACSAMDVISVLRKKRYEVDSYRIEVDRERSAPEGTYPRPITKFVIRHIVKGEGIDPAQVQKAVSLSEEKYCTIMATLRENPAVETSIEVN